MALVIQPSFAKGEIAPALHGRVDTALYQVALKTARNLIIHPFGGASNRAGTIFIGPCKQHTYAPRLIKFAFNTEDQYILEFGNLYMRVIRNDGYVLDSSTTKTISGATKANPCVVTATSHGYSNGDHIYISGVGGMTELNDRWFIVANKSTHTFELTDQADGGNINSTAYTTYTTGGSVSKIYEITTPYVTADLDNLKYVQSADTMTLTHKTYAPRTLTRTDHDAWALATASTGPTITFPTGITVTGNTIGDRRARYTVTAIDEDESLAGTSVTSKNISAITKANPCKITTSASHGYETGDEIHVASAGGMTELNNRRFQITVVDADEFTLNEENSTNYTTYTSGGTVTRTFDEVILQNITGISKQTHAVVTITGGHTFSTGSTALLADIEGMVELNDRRFSTLQEDGNSTQIMVDSTAFTTYTSGGAIWQENTALNTITWTAVTGAKRYAVYKEKSGLFGKIGESTTLTFTDNNHFVDTSITPPRENDPFREAGTYPGAASYYEQRKVLGGSEDHPDTSYYTKTGTENNHTSSSPIQADDAFDATLTSREVNEIRHFVPMNDLLVFTSGSEWKVNSGPDSAFAPETIRQKPQSYWGCSHLRPLIIGNIVLFIEESNAEVRTMGYSLTLDGYTGTLVSLLSDHLLESRTITDWDLEHAPDRRAIFTCSDGIALTMTFDPDQEVLAWTRWDTDGEFERVISLRHGEDNPNDSVYFVVKRTIDGNTVRYVEKLSNTVFDDIQDAFFVDCGLTLDSPVTISGSTAANPVVITATSHGFSDGDEVDITGIVWVSNTDTYGTKAQPDQLNGNRYTVANKTANTFELSGVDGSAFNAYVSDGEVRKAVTAITGAWHLEGEPVAVLANGEVISGHTVTAGAITLATKASRVHIGLPYTSDLETLNIEAPGRTIQGAQKSIGDVTVRVERSRGMIIGHNTDRLVPARDTDFTGEAVDGLLTGDISVVLKPDWNSKGRIFIRQKNPLPLTVLAVIPDIVVEDDKG